MYSDVRPWTWRLVLLLAPAVLVLLVLFGGGLAYSLLQSLGWQPLIGRYELNLDAYARLMFSDAYAEVFWSGLAFSLWISAASTGISALLALGLVWLIYRTGRGTRLWTFLVQFNLPVPHLVAAVGMLFLLAQSGLVSRGTAALGLTETPADFPVLVRDTGGIGIILTYVWKETPFIAVIVLGVLRAVSDSYDAAARSLGANGWQRFRYIMLPLVMPALLSSSLMVFAFTFGAYEIPALTGVRFPRALPVTALRFFMDADLNARTEAMALSVMITAVIAIVIGGYLWLRSSAGRLQSLS
jgi:putative spermidine/putrescine transport system permease protein